MIRYKNIIKTGILFLPLIFTGCSSTVQFPDYSSGIIPLYEQPADWKDAVSKEKTINTYSAGLAGRKIFLDPGHGGDDKKNKSRGGKITEAEVNLRVALHLRKYLEDAGAVVFMSRSDDISVDLRSRSSAAESSGAEIFISIHHNAPGSEADYWSDYTATFFHSREGNYDYEPSSRDLARYIQRDLSYAMRTSGGLGSFDGTYSDFIIYPGEGFAVLRNSKTPAVLIECAFHTSRLEEARLAFGEFNEIQAWGIFKGLGKYFSAGIPAITFEKNLSIISNEETKLVFTLADKSGIDAKTVSVYCNSKIVDFNFNGNVNILEVTLRNLTPGEHIIRVVAANNNRNYSFPFYQKIIIE